MIGNILPNNFIIMTKPAHGLSPALIALMSVATGLAVASNYYAQPLLDTIARHFSLTAGQAGFIVTAAQLGYAAGLLFLVPLKTPTGKGPSGLSVTTPFLLAGP